MKAVFPGRPQAKLQAVSTARWHAQRITVYIAGAALIILGAPNELIQSISLDDETHFTAVAFDKITGKIAASTGRVVYVYQPFGQDVGALKWSLQHSLTPSSSDRTIHSLSWGLPHELLVSGTSLTLFSTGKVARELSTRRLANDAKFAQFSHDASLIASTGRHDRLVKIWKRLFYGGDNARFDVSYLAHPATVTQLRWRGPPGGDEHCDPLLYTLCADNKLRIWTVLDAHGLQALQLWSALDLGSALQSRIPLNPGEPIKRYVCYIDSWDFERAVTKAIDCDIKDEREKHAMNHLRELASEKPEVCVIFDDRGNMSAWGFEHVGSKERKTQDVVNIAHAEGLDLDFASVTSAEEDHVQLYSFLSVENDGHLCVLAQFFDGRLQWLECPLHQFFNPLPQLNRLNSRARFTGHEHTIEALQLLPGGDACVSIAAHGESIIWVRTKDKLLNRHSIIQSQATPLKCLYIAEDDSLVVLNEKTIALWDSSNPKAKELMEQHYDCEGIPLCLTRLQGIDGVENIHRVAMITSEGECLVWEVVAANGEASSRITEAASTNLDVSEAIISCQGVLPMTDVGLKHSQSGHHLVTCNDSGQVVTWSHTRNGQDNSFKWCRRTTFESETQKAFLVRATTTGLVGIVGSNRTSIGIWNVALCCLEHSLQFEDHEELRDIRWTTNGEGCSILAISFRHKSLLYAQRRYELRGPAPWFQVADISIADMVNVNIAASAWIGNDLLLAAGQQLFLYSDKFDIPSSILKGLKLPKTREYHVSAVNQLLNGPLPFFHPIFVSQCLASGNFYLLHTVLLRLQKSLKYFTNGDDLDSFLNIDLAVAAQKALTSGTGADLPVNGDDEEDILFNEDTAISLVDRLSSVKLPHLSDDNQKSLSLLIKQTSFIAKQQNSVDEFALLHLAELPGLVDDAPEAIRNPSHESWRKVCWALHSSSEEILIDLTTRQYKGQLQWQDARSSGMFMWMTDLAALRAQFEVVARNEYTKTDEKNPVDCTLYYLALKKKQVLSGLWRMASWHREQGATQRLLANNFNDPRWKTAALKNAYALLGKRRYEYAASFFLLADNLQGAVNILSSQLGDLQLAIAVARVYEGDDGPVLKALLEDKVLPMAVEQNNAWLASWAFWTLGHKDMALQALTNPLISIVQRQPPLRAATKMYSSQDPSLVLLYRLLRDKIMKESRSSIAISPKAEWDLVMRSTRIYLRMGCDLLALDLVRNWTFLPPSTRTQEETSKTKGAVSGEMIDQAAVVKSTKSLLDDFEEPVTSSAKATEGKRKKAFEEPSTSSIFDSFDF